MCVRACVCVYLTKFVQLHFEEIEHIFENKGNFCPFEFVANECVKLFFIERLWPNFNTSLIQ